MALNTFKCLTPLHFKRLTDGWADNPWTCCPSTCWRKHKN